VWWQGIGNVSSVNLELGLSSKLLLTEEEYQGFIVWRSIESVSSKLQDSQDQGADFTTGTSKQRNFGPETRKCYPFLHFASTPLPNTKLSLCKTKLPTVHSTQYRRLRSLQYTLSSSITTLSSPRFKCGVSSTPKL